MPNQAPTRIGHGPQPPLLPLLLLLLLALAALLLSPSAAASATVPAPPPAFVLWNYATDYYPAPVGSFDARMNVTWQLSPDDPDQVNGVLNYTLYANQTAYVTGWLPFYNFTHFPIPDVPGWVYGNADFTDTTQNGTFFKAYNMTATNSTASAPNTGAISCLLTVNVGPGNGHDQCGTNIQPPSGASARIAVVGTREAIEAVTNLTWALSPDDTNITHGNFSYRVVATLDGITQANFTDPTDAGDDDGLRHYNQTSTGGASNAYQYQFRAEDNAGTHRWSNLSCAVTANTGHLYETNTCGNLGDSFAFDTDGPTFPMVNVPALATGLGITSTQAGLLLFGLFTFALVVGGYFKAGVVGAFLGLILGIAASASLALIPLWIIVAIVMVAASVIVLTLTRGGASS